MKLTTRQKVGICFMVLAAVWTINNAFIVLMSLILNLPLIVGPLGLYLVLTDYKKESNDDPK
jgi:hypothetical protein